MPRITRDLAARLAADLAAVFGLRGHSDRMPEDAARTAGA